MYTYICMYMRINKYLYFNVIADIQILDVCDLLKEFFPWKHGETLGNEKKIIFYNCTIRKKLRVDEWNE